MQDNDYQINDEELESELFDSLPSETEPDPNITKISSRRKLAVLGLAFFSIIILVLWTAQFSRNLETNPLAAEDLKKANMSNAVCEGPECFDDLEQAMSKLQDTDGDGLTDIDEETVYFTSAYIPDTDSDGIEDGKEVENGTDPNCPTGEECSSDPEVTQANGLDIKKPIAIDDLMQASSTTVNEPATTLGKTEIDKLREILVQTGMSQEMLSGISDADIEAAYLDATKNMSTNDTSNTNNISN